MKFNDCDGEGGRVEHDLSVLRQETDDVIKHVLEVLGQQFVSLNREQRKTP